MLKPTPTPPTPATPLRRAAATARPPDRPKLPEGQEAQAGVRPYRGGDPAPGTDPAAAAPTPLPSHPPPQEALSAHAPRLTPLPFRETPAASASAGTFPLPGHAPPLNKAPPPFPQAPPLSCRPFSCEEGASPRPGGAGSGPGRRSRLVGGTLARVGIRKR